MIRVTVSIIFILLNSLTVFCQGNVTFQQITIEDGLSNNTVLDIAQDRFGRVWFATYNGLTFYDGVGYHSINHNTQQAEGSIPAGKAEQVLVDLPGNIWVMFEGNVLACLSGANNKCRVYGAQFSKYGKKMALALNNNGALLVKGEGKTYKFIQGEGRFEVQSTRVSPSLDINRTDELQQQLEKMAPGVEVYSYFEPSATKDIWVATLNSGLFLLPGGKVEKSVNYSMGSEKGRKLSSNEVYCVFVDNSGTIWAGTKDGGVNRGKTENCSFRTLKVAPGPGTSGPLGTIRAIHKDQTGRLWLGTYNHGVVIQENGVPEFISFQEEGGQEKWNWIRCIYQSTDGYIWVGSYAGLCRIDPKTGRRKYYSPEKEQQSITRGRIYSIEEDARGNLLVGEWGSLDYFDRRTNTFHRIDNRSALKDQKIRKLLLTRKGELWVGTESSGAFVLDTADYSLKRRYNDSGDRLNRIINNSIFDIYEDENGTVWLGSSGGINSIDKNGKIDKQESVNEKLPSTLIYKIYGTSRNTIWFSTTKGVVKLDKAEKKVRVYDKGDGCGIFEFAEGAGFQAANGRLYFGGGEGVCRFHPDSVKVSHQVPGVLLESVDIKGKNFTSSGTTTVSLSPRQKDIAFGIRSISPDCADKNEIAWKLKPYDEAFQYANGAVCTPKYFGLASGKYELIVKTANADGIWSGSKLLYTFKIEKPFWEEYYFYLIIICVLVVSVFLVVRIRFKQIKKKNEQLEEQVTRRTRKIQKQKQDLEEINSELEEKNAEILAQHDQILAQRDHLLEMHEKLEQMNQLKQKFFTNISHDIRTPLSLICGPLNEILTKDSLPEELLPKLKRMQTNSNYILQLLNQVLDKKKIEFGGMQVNYTQGDFVKECGAIVNSFSDEAGLNNVELKFVTDKPAFQCRFDYEKLHQVVFNLIANAVKFTPAGGKITCELSIGEEKLKLQVRDSGIGIPKERIRHIFDRYYQVGKSQSKESKGTGIGLSLVKDFVGLLQGTIEVESEEGSGSCFSVSLPRACPAEEVGDNGEGKTIETEEKGKQAGTKSAPTDKDIILLVEDNDELRGYLEEILSGHYKVVAFRDGHKALGYIKNNAAVSLVLSDWMMPEMDGIELCKALKKKSRFRTVPFVLLTALSEIDNQKEGYFAGVDEYISKPFDPDLLKLKISGLLKRNSMIKKAAEVDQTIKPENKEVKTFDEILVDKIKKTVEKQISNPAFGQAELALEIGLTPMQLYRKLKELVQMSPNEFIRTIRIVRAAQLLENKGLIINEVSCMVGFNDPKYFSRCFSKQIGMSPSKYRETVSG